jgi:TRAP-type mannitol/chloroaromatic compound transport system permease large subunit
VIEALAGFAAFLALAFLRVPMAFAMGLVGFFGFAYKVNFNAAASMLAQTTYETGLSYTLSVIPLFILMGNFVVRARMSEELYHAAYTFLGHRRGGLARLRRFAARRRGLLGGSLRVMSATPSRSGRHVGRR